MEAKTTQTDLEEAEDRDRTVDVEDFDRTRFAGDLKTRFTIGDLASEFDVSLRALRFYEDKRLLAPQRHGRMRVYSRRDRARLRLILLGKRVGLSLMEIRELLDSYTKKDRGRMQLKLACAKFDKQEKLLREQRAEIDLSLKELAESLKSIRSKLEMTRQC